MASLTLKVPDPDNTEGMKLRAPDFASAHDLSLEYASPRSTTNGHQDIIEFVEMLQNSQSNPMPLVVDMLASQPTPSINDADMIVDSPAHITPHHSLEADPQAASEVASMTGMPATSSDPSSSSLPAPVDAAQPELTPSTPIEPPKSTAPAKPIVPAPAIGDRYPTRDSFKSACQSYAVSYSIARPDDGFRFSTRTSCVDKFIVFSCYLHTGGCPVTCRAERDKNTNEWVVTNHYYEHRHTGGPRHTDPFKEKPRKFTIIRPKPKSQDHSEDEETDTVFRPPMRARSGSVNSIASAPSRPNKADGKVRSAFVRRQKREFQRMAAGPFGNAPQPSPRHKSEREQGSSLQHNTSSMRSLEEVAASLQALPSPSLSDSSATSSGFLSRSNSFSGGHNYTHAPVAPVDGVRRASFSGAMGNVTQASLEGFLINLHPLLGSLVEPLQKAGVESVATLLSLEQAELSGLVDSIETSPLLRMLVKNRVGRTLEVPPMY